jgi:two-component system, cell cycle response regulator DivK
VAKFLDIITKKKPMNSSMMHNKPILIIEDDEASAYYLEEIVSEMGGKTIMASTGKEAMTVLENHEISLILMDIRLPDIDGYELTKQFRQHGINIPIIAQTAYVMIDDRQKAINSGCNDYLAKPILKAHLLGMLTKYLDVNAYSSLTVIR